jgi:glycosyltransferase involved in cell wall biosynthesis
MVAAGHEVIACAPGNDDRFAQLIRSLGVRYHSIRLDRTGINPIRDLSYFMEMLNFFQQERPHVVFSYTAKPVIYGSLAAQLAGVPRIFSMVTGLGYVFASNQLKQRLLGIVVRRLYRLGLAVNRSIFFQNPDDIDLFTRWGLVTAKRVVMINGSGVNLEYYGLVPQVTSPPIFLLIGRMLKDKGVQEFLNAAKRLKVSYPEAVFRLVGPHDDHPATVPWSHIQERIKTGMVEYFGETDDIRPFMAEASVYVLPSYREGTPRSVLEAMAMGRPVITTDVPGCRETVIDGENGFLVPVGDAGALADAMEHIILHPELLERMGKRGREIAEEKYDVRKVNAVILKTMGLIGEEGL